MKNKAFQFAILSGLLALGACGSDDDSTNVVVNVPDTAPQEQQEEQGPVDTGPTVRVNTEVNNTVIINSRTRVDNEDYQMRWECGALDQEVHPQYVHLSPVCPTLEANDTNGDGFLDPAEVEQVIGAPVLALDEDPTSPEVTAFPEGLAYSYDKRIPLSQLRQSVPQGEDFVLMVYGASPAREFPDTYANDTGQANYLTVPVACKVFEAPDLTTEETEDTDGR